jgi:CheY-like chemotaxis protein
MSGADRRVLIVEDDPDIVDYLSFFLEDEGYKVEAASRCSTAREMMDDFRPEVILIDCPAAGQVRPRAARLVAPRSAVERAADGRRDRQRHPPRR